MSEYDNDFLDAYMQMVEQTESPRVFHLWSALAGISACLGRRVFLPFGFTKMYANMYILLVGPAASRKNTAINIMQGFIRKGTGVKFAQDDCAGKKQGIIAVMAGEDEEELETAEIERQLENLASLTPATLSTVVIPGPAKVNDGNTRNKEDGHAIFVVSNEFTAFTGQNNREFIDFLTKIYDGEAYDYRLKNKKERVTMEDPLIGIVGGTTPTNIADSLPPSAIGQGFTSRVIFVFGARKYKSIARPDPLEEDLKRFVQKRYSEIYYNLHGELGETTEAKQYANSIYERHNDLTDGRFTYYLARRHTHFLKLGMIMAASRMSGTVELQDYMQADALLKATEASMPDALGEFGQSAISAAKQKIIEFINYNHEPISHQTLWAFMGRDLRMHELSTIINELISTQKIQAVKSMISDTVVYIPFVHGREAEVINLMDVSATAASTETLQ